jgi:4-hydroxybenzoate polyprenyltransferase
MGMESAPAVADGLAGVLRRYEVSRLSQAPWGKLSSQPADQSLAMTRAGAGSTFGALLDLSRPWMLGFTLLPGLLAILSFRGVTVSALMRFCIFLLAFHFVGYALNDLCHRSIDRLDSSRHHRPLISGTISEHAVVVSLALALIIAIGALPLMGPFSLRQHLLACAALGLAVTYNVASKHCGSVGLCILSDAFLGIAMGVAPLLGAAMAAHQPTSWIVFLTINQALYAMLVNGVHGSLRDLRHESALGIMTTASALGATVADGCLDPGPRLTAYARALHTLLLGLQALGLFAVCSATSITCQRLAIVVSAESFLLLFAYQTLPRSLRLLRADTVRATAVGTLNMLLLFLSPWILSLTVATPVHALATLGVAGLPLTLHPWFRNLPKSLASFRRKT